jgi:hypothetical protein
MMQHARDLSHSARQRGRRHLPALWLHIVRDGLANALLEQKEAIMARRESYKPAPWLFVFLTSVPGLWVALSRRHADQFEVLLLLLGGGAILLFAIVLPVLWWRQRRFPVWGLMFAGALAWFFTYWLGTQLSQQVTLPIYLGWEMGITLVNTVLALVLFVVLLSGRRLPASVWAVLGIIGLIYVLGAIIFASFQPVSGMQTRELLRTMTAALGLLAEGLMLVAVGLLAVRQHGLLAILVVIGGYGYMFMDTDYLFGYPVRDYGALPFYLFAVSFLYLVVTPIALLRAKTRRGRAVAVFVPVILFLLIRLLAPILITGQSLSALRPGDVGMSLNVLLALVLAWFLYSRMAVPREAPADPQPAAVT